VLRIRDVYPGAEFFHPESQIQGKKDSGSRIRIKELKYVINPNFQSCRKYDLDLDFFTYPGSRGQKGTESRIRIRN
jgi:hypothetical protein